MQHVNVASSPADYAAQVIEHYPAEFAKGSVVQRLLLALLEVCFGSVAALL
jgi:hypothetical protein